MHTYFKCKSKIDKTFLRCFLLQTKHTMLLQADAIQQENM